MKRKTKWTHEQLVEAVKNNISFSSVLKELKLRSAGSNWKTIKKYIQDYQIDTSHFFNNPQQVSCYLRKVENKYKESEIFCKNSRVHRSSLRRLLRQKLPYICDICKNRGEHLGNPLVLQMDHKNGISDDNRLENLRWLCPNCHSQTDTFAGRKNALVFCFTCDTPTRKRSGYCSKKCRPIKTKPVTRERITRKIVWPDKNVVFDRAMDVGFEQCGRELGLSGNAVKKFLKRNGLMLPRYHTQSKY